MLVKLVESTFRLGNGLIFIKITLILKQIFQIIKIMVE